MVMVLYSRVAVMFIKFIDTAEMEY